MTRKYTRNLLWRVKYTRNLLLRVTSRPFLTDCEYGQALNMSTSNPMTIGLLTSWENTGKKPAGRMGQWGNDGSFGAPAKAAAEDGHEEL